MDKSDIIIDIESLGMTLNKIHENSKASNPINFCHEPVQVYMAQGYPHPPGRDYYGGGGYPGGYPRNNNYSERRNGGNAGYDLPTVYDIDDNNIRNQFVRKVFFTLAIQLGVTILIMSFCYLTDGFRNFLMRNSWFQYLCLIVFMISYFGMICSDCLRNFPVNYICITILTLAMALTVSCFTVFRRWEIVLGAMGATVLIVVILTILAYSSIDFTKFYIYFIVFAMIMMVFGMAVLITRIFYKRIPWLHLVYSCLMVFLYSGFILIDLQMILGGRSLEMSPEDYILASALLYTSIVSLFISLLSIFDS